MDEHGGDCLVGGYEKHIAAINLPDMDDRHVVAAGIEAKVDSIITWNLRDFPKKVIKAHGMTVLTPDELVGLLIKTNKVGVRAAMTAHRLSLKNPSKTPQEYLETLKLQGLTKAVAALGNVPDLG